MQMGLVAGAGDEGRGVDLSETFGRKPTAQGRLDAVACQKGRAAAFMLGRMPPFLRIRHDMCLSSGDFGQDALRPSANGPRNR